MVRTARHPVYRTVGAHYRKHICFDHAGSIGACVILPETAGINRCRGGESIIFSIVAHEVFYRTRRLQIFWVAPLHPTQHFYRPSGGQTWIFTRCLLTTAPAWIPMQVQCLRRKERQSAIVRTIMISARLIRYRRIHFQRQRRIPRTHHRQRKWKCRRRRAVRQTMETFARSIAVCRQAQPCNTGRTASSL